MGFRLGVILLGVGSILSSLGVCFGLFARLVRTRLRLRLVDPWLSANLLIWGLCMVVGGLLLIGKFGAEDFDRFTLFIVMGTGGLVFGAFGVPYLYTGLESEPLRRFAVIMMIVAILLIASAIVLLSGYGASLDGSPAGKRGLWAQVLRSFYLLFNANFLHTFVPMYGITLLSLIYANIVAYRRRCNAIQYAVLNISCFIMTLAFSGAFGIVRS